MDLAPKLRSSGLIIVLIAFHLGHPPTMDAWLIGVRACWINAGTPCLVPNALTHLTQAGRWGL